MEKWDDLREINHRKNQENAGLTEDKNENV